MDREHPVEIVLQLACAAERQQGGYVKEIESVFASDGQFAFMKQPNKTLIQLALGATWSGDPVLRPESLHITSDDIELAKEIKSYFKRLMFAAIAGENEFKTEVNHLLTAGVVPNNRLGFIACLPSVYKRDYAITQTEKRVKTLDEGYLGDIGTTVLDKDCEVLSSKRSKNFDAYNIDAIIDNKMVSWFSKTDLKLGPCVVVKGKVKDHSTHWKHHNPVTRLNFVKAAQ
jgi:hypothetical protein